MFNNYLKSINWIQTFTIVIKYLNVSEDKDTKAPKMPKNLKSTKTPAAREPDNGKGKCGCLHT